MAAVRSRRHLRTMPKPPKAWTRVHGYVYGIKWEGVGRTWLLRRRKTRIEYVGMHSGYWPERIRQHLYGGGPHRCVPKPWNVLVPGYDPAARTLAQQKRAVQRVIETGGAVVLWESRCWHWWVKFRESLAIGKHRPAGNIQENLDNPRHIPKWEQEAYVASVVAKRDRAATRQREEAVMGIRKLPDGSWVSYGQVGAWVGE